jgi:hypothetical protein
MRFKLFLASSSSASAVAAACARETVAFDTSTLLVAVLIPSSMLRVLRAPLLPRAVLGGNLTLLIDNLLLQVVLVGKRLVQGILIRARINGKQKVPFLNQLIVFNRQLNDTAVDLSHNLDEISPDICVVGFRLAVRLVEGDDQQQAGKLNDHAGIEKCYWTYLRFELAADQLLARKKGQNHGSRQTDHPNWEERSDDFD